MRSIPALAALAVLSTTAFAGTRYVNGSLTTGANDGTSWADAYRGADALAVAIAAAQPADEIWVVAGRYLPNLTLTRSEPFSINKEISLYGGFVGTETQLAQRDFKANVTLLSGDLAGNDASGLHGDNTFHVLVCRTQACTATIDGFTLSGGVATSPQGNNLIGGGLLVTNVAAPVLRNCIFTDNRAHSRGGGAFVGSQSAAFIDCTFDGNHVGTYGGGLYAGNFTTVDRCVFVNNTAFRGSAIEIYGSCTLTNSLIHHNHCPDEGGGAAVSVELSFGVSIVNCTVVDNSAPNWNYAGIYAAGINNLTTIKNCIAFGNTSMSPGGATNIWPTSLAGVRYTLTEHGHAGTGNIAATPVFEPCIPDAYILAPHSPGIDAGDNAAVPAGLTLDVVARRRFQDIAAVADTGSGTAPIVDIGAWEGASDCNQNGVDDWCDIQFGVSLDANSDGVPDECECPLANPPFTYCTAQFNSQLCLPLIAWSGLTSLANAAPFQIAAASILNNTPGLLFYGHQPAATPYFNFGTLCVASPLKRTPAMNSGGNPTGVDCSGTFTFDFNAWIASGADASLQIVGRQVNAQYWSRDPTAPGHGNLTDAVQFVVCP